MQRSTMVHVKVPNKTTVAPLPKSASDVDCVCRLRNAAFLISDSNYPIELSVDIVTCHDKAPQKKI